MKKRSKIAIKKTYNSETAAMPISGGFKTIDEPIAYMRMGAALRADELGVDRELAMDFAEAGYRTAQNSLLTIEQAHRAACDAYNSYSSDQAPKTWGQWCLELLTRAASKK